MPGPVTYIFSEYHEIGTNMIPILEVRQLKLGKTGPKVNRTKMC